MGACKHGDQPGSVSCPPASQTVTAVAVGNEVTETLTRLLLERSTSQQMTDWIEVGKLKLLNLSTFASITAGKRVLSEQPGAESDGVAPVRQSADDVRVSGCDFHRYVSNSRPTGSQPSNRQPAVTTQRSVEDLS